MFAAATLCACVSTAAHGLAAGISWADATEEEEQQQSRAANNQTSAFPSTAISSSSLFATSAAVAPAMPAVASAASSAFASPAASSSSSSFVVASIAPCVAHGEDQLASLLDVAAAADVDCDPLRQKVQQLVQDGTLQVPDADELLDFEDDEEMRAAALAAAQELE